MDNFTLQNQLSKYRSNITSNLYMDRFRLNKVQLVIQINLLRLHARHMLQVQQEEYRERKQV